MDQRRFTTFLLLMLAAWMLSNVLFPPPPRQPAGQQEAEVEVEQEADTAPDDQPAAEMAPGAPPTPSLADLEPAAVDDDVPLELVTLGSVDPQGGYPMLVTITNQGAGIHRVELANRRFRDDDERSGYLGQIVASLDAPSGEAIEPGEADPEPGVEVQVVGPGTPAAEAGLKVGDRIVGLLPSDPKATELEIAITEDLRAVLGTTKPGQTIALRVERDGQQLEPIEVKLRRRPLEVIRPEIENLRLRNADVPVDFEGPPSFLTSLQSLDGRRFEDEDRAQIDALLRAGHWEIVERQAESVTLRRALPQLGLEFIKRYSIQEVPEERRDDHSYPGYNLDMDVVIRNTGDQDRTLAYTLSGPNGLPIEGWWYSRKISRTFSSAGLRDVIVRFNNEDVEQIRCPKIADDETEPMGQGSSLAYAAVDAQYFAAALIPRKESIDEVWFEKTEAVRIGPKPAGKEPKTYANVSFEVERRSMPVAAGATLRDSYNIFLGPKRPELLKNYYVADARQYNLSDLLYYGWFGSIAKVMLAILHFFYSIVGNYGIAIIMLTVTVRLCMFPLSLKQTQSMARMQALKPEMDKINEKYKNDMQKKQQAMQELYGKHKINPLSGCLPMFIQFPVFMSLYRGLMVDVELRQSPLFGEAIRWCSNLAAPDRLYDWSWLMPASFNNGLGLFALGPYLNVFPLVTVVLFLTSQRMFMPEPANEQARTQQSMMKFMTLFMGLIFYKVASGLCLYFIVSSLWGIMERKLLPRATPATDALSAGGNPPAAGGSGDRPHPPRGDGSAPRNGSPKRKKRQKVKRKK